MCCIFCNSPEKAYTPSKKIDFVCSICVQMLLAADPDDLKRAHDAAINRKYLNQEHRKACEPEYLRKANAIKSFLIEEGAHVRPKNPKRGQRNLTKHFNRAGNRKTSRSHQRPARSITDKKRIAFHKNQ